jgi:hypothetical protein
VMTLFLLRLSAPLSSSRKRGPITTVVMVERVRAASLWHLPHHRRRCLWVPAFARTTAECLSAPCENSEFKFQTANLPRSRGAMRPRFASPPRTARGDGAVGGARAPTGTLEAGLTYPPRAARHRARPRLGAAPPSAPPATRPSTVPGRPGPASFRSVR